MKHDEYASSIQNISEEVESQFERTEKMKFHYCKSVKQMDEKREAEVEEAEVEEAKLRKVVDEREQAVKRSVRWKRYLLSNMLMIFMK